VKPVGHLGDGIRAERLKQELTLAQLAERTGLSTSALSQVERGLTEPSISSLRRIATALGQPVFQFLLDPTHPDPVVRKSARRTITFKDSTSHYQLLTPSTRGAFEVLSLELAPIAASGDVALGHDSEELLLVIRGDIEAEVAGQTYKLSAGDSLYLQRNVPHRAINRGTTVAEILMVISPASF
jgi:transcriptional regulator with XRE-family HTH domain